MIIVRSPLRCSLFGGATDVKSYYEKHGSLVIGFTIDKYIYVALKESNHLFNYNSRISYSKTEDVLKNSDIENPGVRGVLELMNATDGLEICLMSDLPARTGLGSSSSMVVGLLKAVDIYYNGYERLTSKELAEKAIYVERVLLNEPGGVQDEVWAACSKGLSSINIDKNGDFIVRPLRVSDEFLEFFRQRMVLCYLGSERNSFEIAASHDKQDNDSIKKQIHNIAQHGLVAFENEDISEIGRLLHRSWQLKRSMSDKISNEYVDSIYNLGIDNGATGGKLLGSGGSGFMLFVLKENIDRDLFIKNIGLKTVDFNYSYKGSEVLLK